MGTGLVNTALNHLKSCRRLQFMSTARFHCYAISHTFLQHFTVTVILSLTMFENSYYFGIIIKADVNQKPSLSHKDLERVMSVFITSRKDHGSFLNEGKLTHPLDSLNGPGCSWRTLNRLLKVTTKVWARLQHKSCQCPLCCCPQALEESTLLNSLVPPLTVEKFQLSLVKYLKEIFQDLCCRFSEPVQSYEQALE